MTASEMPRMVKLRQIDGSPVRVEASAAERAALAKRFGVAAIDSLVAEATLDREGDEVGVSGRLRAALVQTCGVSGEDFPVEIDERFAFRFVPTLARGEPDDEIELAEDDLDEIEYTGEAFDLGEAIAQSLGLAIDPYAEGPNADAVRQEAGIVGDDTPSGPLADALRALTKD